MTKRHKKKAEITRTQNCQTSELLEMCIKFFCSLSLSCLSHSRSGDGSPLRSSPGSSIGVLGRFDSGDLAMTPTAPSRVLGSVTPDVLASHQHHCNVDKWRSLDVRCSAGRPPTMENGLLLLLILILILILLYASNCKLLFPVYFIPM